MNPIECIKMAVATLTADKLRSSLTMLGIVIGNASVIAMVGIGQGAQNYTLNKLDSFGPNRLLVFSSHDDLEGFISEKRGLVLSDAEAIRTQAPAVKSAAPVIENNLLISYRNNQTYTQVKGTTPALRTIRNLTIDRGRFFDANLMHQSSSVVVLGAELAEKLFDRQNPIGKEVQIKDTSFQVIGVMIAKGSFAGENEDNVVYIPITTMATQIDGGRSAFGTPISHIQVAAKDKQSVRVAAFQITNLLTRLHGRKDFVVVANKSFQELVSQVTGVLSLMLGAIAGVSLFVGGVGIMNIMLVSVTERTPEIGLRKAIGATPQAILAQFLVESIILSVSGGLIGTAIGIGGVAVVGVLTPLQPSVSMTAIALAVGISGCVGLIFGVVPARRAAQLDPIIALKNS
jgi:putative ABC transport system permease protein